MLKRLRSLLIFMGLVWVAGEILSRLFLPAGPPQPEAPWSQEHPYIRSDWVPGYRTTRIVEGIGGQKGTMELEINPFGFRARTMKTAQKPEGTYRIFFLGGSTTESIVLPEEKTFPALVEKKLKSAIPGTQFESINGGISGYMASDILALLIYKVMYYEPDLVMVMTGLNDLRYGTVPTYDPVRHPDLQRKLYRPGYAEGLPALLGKILRKSHFFALIEKRLLGRLLLPLKQSHKSARKVYEEAYRERKTTPLRDVAESRAMKEFTKSLEEIIFITKGHGVRLIFMTEPSLYQENLPAEMDQKLWMGLVRPKINLSHDFLLRETRRFNDTVRGLSEKYGVELIDLDREAPKDLEHFYDDAHFTPQGSERSAEAIASYLIQTGNLHSPAQK